MNLSNGYTYMLSISQFLNSLAQYCDVYLLSLDTEAEFNSYLEKNIGIKKSDNLKVIKISNKKFGIKSNRLFFSKNVIKYIKINFSNTPIVIYTRDFKQMKEMLKNKNKLKTAKFIFEAHQILSQNYCRETKYKQALKMKKLEEYVFNNIDLLLCITKTLSNEILKNFPKNIDKNVILPIGFSSSFLNITQDKNKKYDLIYTGSFSKWKGMDFLLETLISAAKKMPTFC